jgi:hypothetical protein
LGKKLFTSIDSKRLKHSESYNEEIVTASKSLHKTLECRKLSYRNGYGVTDYTGKE